MYNKEDYNLTETNHTNNFKKNINEKIFVD